jgi:glucose-6-phosphate isomerase
MDNLQLWQRYQDWLYYNQDLDFYLDVSRMGFDDDFVEQIKPKFAKAFQDMDDLEKGAIANPDEKRMVGHYWLRNADLAPNDKFKKDIIDTLEQIKTFTRQIHNGEIHPPNEAKFTDILSIGIGGSALGPEFVAEALSRVNPPLNIHFIDNSDPEGIDRIFDKIGDRLKTTLVLIISKSGGTPETRNGMIEAKNAYEKKGLDFPRYTVAVTAMGMDSKLEKQALTENWLGIFPMHDWIGGRTSELSAVGLLPAALQGIDIDSMLEGAKIMDEATRKPNLKTNPAALLALSWYYGTGGKGEKDMVVLPYKDSLLLFSRYLQQLVMESLGKEKDLEGNTVYQGIAVYGNKGSTDQHAYVQQLREGVPNFFVTFIEVLKDRQGQSIEIEKGATAGDFLCGFLLGTREALWENGRDSVTVTIKEVNPFSVGALIALYERAVSFYASLVNINAYHQPGVEAGKKAAQVILELQQKVLEVLSNNSSPLFLSELASKTNAIDAIETIYKIVRHLEANNRVILIKDNLSQLDRLRISLIK